jgi:uncharacterized YceG family protein
MSVLSSLNARLSAVRERMSVYHVDAFVPSLVLAVLLAFWLPGPGAYEGTLSLKKLAGAGICLVFFLYGLKLEPKQWLADLGNWKVHLTVQLATFVFFPLLILLVRTLWNASEGNLLWLGVFYLAALPSTVSSSVVMVSLARGNVPSAIFNATFSSLAGVFLTPLWMGLFLSSVPGYEALAGMITKLVLQVLLPIALGMVLSRWGGALARKYGRRLRLIDQMVILLVVYTSFSESFEQDLFRVFGWTTMLLLLLGMAALFLVSFLCLNALSGLLHFSRPDRITAVFCGSKKSLMHGTVMSKVMFPASAAGVVILPLMIYHILQLIMVGFIASSMGRTSDSSCQSEPSSGRGARFTRKPLRLMVLVLFVAFLGFVVARHQYLRFFGPGLLLRESPVYVHIPTGATYDQVKVLLQPFLRYPGAFDRLAGVMKYKERVKPGRYELSSGMSNRQLLVLLRAARQTPVSLVFNSIRTREQLCGTIARQIEADSLSLMKILRDTALLRECGVDTLTVLTLFFPNTYEVYWNTSARGLVQRMAREHRAFWNAARMELLKATGLSREEAYILASIIEEETRKEDEKPIIAGLYLNRLRKGMLLQADPTVKFAWGDFTLKRILNRHLSIHSPYNTYKFPGLPPGPICIPSVSTVDAVLHYARHNYLYFCVRDDFSGYHHFSVTHSQHIQYARRYHAALNRLKIQ